METAVKMLSRFVCHTRYETLPETVVCCVKERIIDIMSAAMAGASLWEKSGEIIKTAKDMELAGNSTVIGRNVTVSFPAAAAINCAYAHSVELDDGHKNAGIHAGAVVVPTALSLAEKIGVGGSEVIAAIVVGYEVAYRFAVSMSPLMIENGYHPSAICGTMGAAAAAASIMKLDCRQTAEALSLSALFASGTMEATHSGQSSKGAMVGHAAFAGINAAVMAKNGFVGPHAPFSGASGLFKIIAGGNVDVEKMLKRIGEEYWIKDTYVKLYPTCRHTHAPIEGAIAICSENDVEWSDIAKAEIGTYPIAYQLTGAEELPSDTQRARFSTRYCVASAMLNRSFGIADLKDDNLRDERRRRLSGLVRVYIDDEVTREFPQRRGARIRIELANGKAFEKTLYDLKGAPENPVDFADLCSKFENMASATLSKVMIEKICEEVANLERLRDIRAFISLTKSA